MKIPASLLCFGLFLCAPAFVAAQDPVKPAETPPVQQGEKPVEKPAEKPKEKKDDCANCLDGKMQPATPATAKAAPTKGMQLKEFTLISDILAAPEKFEGKRVLVKGLAVGTCETRGCWVNLKSDKDTNKAIRIKVEDGEIVFPMTVLGKEVQAEGIVEKMVIPVETVREILAKNAAAKGQKFDPETVKEPRIVWQIKGLGAKFDAKPAEKKPVDAK